MKVRIMKDDSGYHLECRRLFFWGKPPYMKWQTCYDTLIDAEKALQQMQVKTIKVKEFK